MNHPQRMLTMRSLAVTSNAPLEYSLTLAESKTDAYSEGVALPVSGPSATAAMRSYLSKRPGGAPGPNAPLFARADGSPLTHKWLVDTTSALVSLARVPMVDRVTGRTCVGVSFRSGGATALAEAGVSDRQIQILGRWKSFCYQRYIRESTATLSTVFKLF